MKFCLIVAGIVARNVGGSQAENWACNFVGLRLARTPSKCVSGMCSGLEVLQRMGMSCSRASELVRNMAQTIAKSDEDIAVESLQRIIRDTGRDVFKLFLIGAKVDVESHKAILQEIDSSIGSSFLKSPELITFLKTTPEVSDLNQLVSEAIHYSMTNSFLADVHNPRSDLIHYHFVMDWVSWFGLPAGVIYKDLTAIQIGSMHKASRYRLKRFPLELRLRDENQQPQGTEALIELMDLIDELSRYLRLDRNGERVGNEFTSTRELALLVARWNMGLPDAVTDVLVEHIQKSEICENINGLSVLARQNLTVLWRKTVLTFMELCRRPTNTADIVFAGVFLERASFGPHHVQKYPDASWSTEKIVFDMIENPRQYLPGVEVRDKSPKRLAAILEEFRYITGVIRRDGSFYSPRDFEDTPHFPFRARVRALGQGMGAILASKSKLLENRFGYVLKLQSDIAMAIHTPPENCSIDLLNVIFDIREGFRDGMGGLGVSAFTKDQWGYLFSTRPGFLLRP